MSKQLMKSLVLLTLVVGLALASSEASANGQLTSQIVSADVPFDFIVADQTLPSGKYTVRKTTHDGKGLTISSLDGKLSAVRLSNSVFSANKNLNARMVFHRYGQQYFLAEVWSGDYGRELIKSKMERKLQREQELIASNRDSGKGTYEVVEVLAMVR